MLKGAVASGKYMMVENFAEVLMEEREGLAYVTVEAVVDASSGYASVERGVCEVVTMRQDMFL